MQAVVSGSAGFIGRHLVDELIARGYRVAGIDRQPGHTEPGYEHHTLDLSDPTAYEAVAGVVRRADVVFHLAARPGVRGRGPVIEEKRRGDNFVATSNLVSLVPADTPFVATSSSSVYGGSVCGVPSREDDPLRPRGGYAHSKVAMEQVCEQRRARGGLVAVIRPFTVAGEGQTVNLGTGVGHSLIEMAKALLAVPGLDGAIVQHPVSPDEADATLADTRVCREVLGFVPTTDLPALLARQLEAADRTESLVTA